jgi:hypothetical protein
MCFYSPFDFQEGQKLTAAKNSVNEWTVAAVGLIWVVVSVLCADSFEPQARRYSKSGHCDFVTAAGEGGKGKEKPGQAARR